MSVKSKLLDEINKKAQRIREKRVEASQNKNLEAYIFEYFKQVEELEQFKDLLIQNVMRHEALAALSQKVKTVDHTGCKVEAVYRLDGNIQGVKIRWSKVYQQKNQCDSESYYDVSMILLS